MTVSMPMKPGLVVKHSDEASTDAGSSEEVLPTRPAGGRDRPQAAQAAKPRRARRHKKEQKEVSDLRCELRARGKEVMSEVAQGCAKAKSRPSELRAPPGLTLLPEKPEAYRGHSRREGEGLQAEHGLRPAGEFIQRTACKNKMRQVFQDEPAEAWRSDLSGLQAVAWLRL
ncbi:unnamed protein product [Effrenium voratum]|nr:unnamed protein product [Effrenium voratum]